MNDYVAWIDATPVAYGPRRTVEAAAREIVASDQWQYMEPGPTSIRITRGPRQLFVAAFIITSREEARA